MGRWTGRKDDGGVRGVPGDYLADYFNRPANRRQAPAPYDSLAGSGTTQHPRPGAGQSNQRGPARPTDSGRHPQTTQSGQPVRGFIDTSTIGAPAGRRTRRRRRYPGVPGGTGQAPGGTAQTPYEPPPTPAGAEPKKRSRTRLGVLLTALVLAVGLGAGLVGTQLGSSTFSPPSFVPGAPDLAADAEVDLPVRWELHPEDLVDAGSGYPQFAAISEADTPGRHNPPIAVTPEAWVVAVTAADRRWLAAVDPTDGTPLWERELSDGMCATATTEDGGLVCAGRQDGDWHGYLIDPGTGAEQDSWPIPVTGVWGMHLSAEGLLVISESAPLMHDRLSLLDVPGGIEQWSVDLMEDDANEWFFIERERDGTTRTVPWHPIWRDIGPNVAMLGASAHLLIDPAEGTVRTLPCAPAVVVDDTLACSSYRETTLYDAHGQEIWTSPRVQLADPAYGEADVPINVRDETLWAMDWTSGTVGAELASASGNPRATGTPQHPFLVGETEVLSLDADQTRVRWSAPMSGIDSLTAVKVIDDVAVVVGWSAVGLDLQTGEQLWHRDYPHPLRVLDDQLVSVEMFHLKVLDLP